MRKIAKLTLTVALAALCIMTASCSWKNKGKDEGVSSEVSSQQTEQQMTELEALMADEEFQEQVDLLSKTYEQKGMRLEISAEGNTVVYKCIFTVPLDEKTTKESLEEHLKSKEFATSIESVLRSFKLQVPTTYSVIVRYIDVDGNIIASREYK